MKEYKYKINGNNGNLYKVTVGNIEDNIADVEVNGTHYKVEMEKAPQPKPVVVKPVVRQAATTPAKVNVGDAVKKGQTVVILEAMKMENSINADKDGKITAINVKQGDSVLEGTDLVIIE